MKDSRGVFSFFSKKPEQIKAEEKEKKAIQEAAQGALDSAQECLSSPQFARYKDKYKEAERDLIEIGIRLENTDPYLYNSLCMMIFDRLNIIRILLNEVQKDSRR